MKKSSGAMNVNQLTRCGIMFITNSSFSNLVSVRKANEGSNEGKQAC